MHIRREYIHGPGIDNPIAMITFCDDELVGLYFYHTDALGSVIAMTSVNGVVAEKYRYSPFGRTTIYDGSGSEIARSAIGNPYMFTARRLDEESGLYYYRARMYKPEIGRFLQTDPLGYIDTINPYAYCANNPLNRIDPWGLYSWKELGEDLNHIAEAIVDVFVYPSWGHNAEDVITKAINQANSIEDSDAMFLYFNSGGYNKCVAEGVGVGGDAIKETANKLLTGYGGAAVGNVLDTMHHGEVFNTYYQKGNKAKDYIDVIGETLENERNEE